ncbi:MAG: hypothetical protein LC732_05110 [Acidobacteria bacterium]|nr:hypothetical protein [Acidobacteriota bacterium]
MHETDTTSGADLFALQKPALIVGVIALVGLLIGAFLDTDQFFRSYLMGWLLIVMITTGALAVLMIQYLSGGRWGVIIRRPAEAVVSTIPFVGLAMIPILVGMHSIYAWTHTDLVAHDALLQHKEAYLNVPFFIGRAVLYFAIWSVLALMLVRWGRSLDENHDGWVELRIRRVAAAGILALGLTLTFASVDWIMSLEPHWFSTMFGISFIIGSLLAGWTVIILMVVRLSRSQPYLGVVQPLFFRDLGNLMLAFTMLWAYTSFSQFLLIWYGNIREETPYYIVRSQGGWGVIAVALLVFHFFLPFTLLLMRRIKDEAKTLAMVAALMLLMRAIRELRRRLFPLRVHQEFAEGSGAAAGLAGRSGRAEAAPDPASSAVPRAGAGRANEPPRNRTAG